MNRIRPRPPLVAFRVHVLVGIFVIVGLPVFSWWNGEGGLAFTMFSRSGSYRLRVVASDQSGADRPLAPTAIAARAGGTIGDALAGSEAWRFAPFAELIRRHLDEVAGLACAAASPSRKASVTLEERRTMDAPVRTTTVTRPCR